MNFIEVWAANKYIRRLENSMGQNWKGKIGAIGAILGSLAGAATDWSSGTLDIQKIMNYFALAMGGLSLLGIRQAVGRAAAGQPEAQTTVDTKPPVPKI